MTSRDVCLGRSSRIPWGYEVSKEVYRRGLPKPSVKRGAHCVAPLDGSLYPAPLLQPSGNCGVASPTSLLWSEGMSFVVAFETSSTVDAKPGPEHPESSPTSTAAPCRLHHWFYSATYQRQTIRSNLHSWSTMRPTLIRRAGFVPHTLRSQDNRRCMRTNIVNPGFHSQVFTGRTTCLSGKESIRLTMGYDNGKK